MSSSTGNRILTQGQAVLGNIYWKRFPGPVHFYWVRSSSWESEFIKCASGDEILGISGLSAVITIFPNCVYWQCRHAYI